MEWIILVVIAAMNIFTFALYGVDKSKAQKKAHRISEATLITCAFLMGGIGALLGMSIFRHKTNKPKFKILVPIAVIINLVIIAAYLFFVI